MLETVKNTNPIDQPELQLVHRIKFWEGIFKPSSHFATLRNAETIKGLIWRVLLISFLAGILTAASTYVSFELNLMPNTGDIPGLDTDMVKMFAVIGGGVGGIFGIPLYMLIAAAILTIFFRDVSFGKQFAIQGYASFITIINMAITIPLMYVTNTITPFFSLGIIGEALNAGPFLQGLLSSITIFFIWQVALMIGALKQASTKPSKYVVSVIITLNVIYLLFGAAMAKVGTSMANLGM